MKAASVTTDVATSVLLIKQISLCRTKLHQTSWHQITVASSSQPFFIFWTLRFDCIGAGCWSSSSPSRFWLLWSSTNALLVFAFYCFESGKSLLSLPQSQFLLLNSTDLGPWCSGQTISLPRSLMEISHHRHHLLLRLHCLFPKLPCVICNDLGCHGQSSFNTGLGHQQRMCIFKNLLVCTNCRGDRCKLEVPLYKSASRFNKLDSTNAGQNAPKCCLTNSHPSHS